MLFQFIFICFLMTANGFLMKPNLRTLVNITSFKISFISTFTREINIPDLLISNNNMNVFMLFIYIYSQNWLVEEEIAKLNTIPVFSKKISFFRKLLFIIIIIFNKEVLSVT